MSIKTTAAFGENIKQLTITQAFSGYYQIIMDGKVYGGVFYNNGVCTDGSPAPKFTTDDLQILADIIKPPTPKGE